MLAPQDAASLFKTFYERGVSHLDRMEQAVSEPLLKKLPRLFSVFEAAGLIGCPKNLLPDPGEGFTLAQINQIRQDLGLRYQRPAGSRSAVMPIINFKGGVGKSTICIHLAQRAAMDGLRVLIIDLDPQGTSSHNLMVRVEEGDEFVGDALVEQPADLKYSVRSTYFEGVMIIPSDLDLTDIELQLGNRDTSNAETLGPSVKRLEAGLAEIREDFDLILIDCPPNLGPLTTNALFAANALLLPLPPYTFDTASFVHLVGRLAYVFEVGTNQLEYLRILISKHPHTQTSNLIEGGIRELYGEYVMTSVLSETTEIERATRELSSVYDEGQTESNRKTRRRALKILDEVNLEIIGDLKALWGSQV